MKQKIVILTGAGISAESGISTFRDSNGLWENHKIEDVASPAGWRKNKELVLDFYNKRRSQLPSVEPNEGHKQLVRLEEKYDVTIITQNVDDLHERAGSKNIIHLHGELTKAQSTLDPSIVIEIGTKDINIGDKCEKGSQLRPFIVWFGEDVPKISDAARTTMKADIFIIVGTSMQVYPAAGLIDYVGQGKPIYLVDPNEISIDPMPNLKVIQDKASTGLKTVVDELMA